MNLVIEATWNKTNTSETFGGDSSRRNITVIGYPGPWFDAIHISALVVLSLNTLSTIILFIYLCGCRKGVKKARGITNTSAIGKNAAKHRLAATSDRNLDRSNDSTEDASSTEMSRKPLNNTGSAKNSLSDISTGIANNRRPITGKFLKSKNDTSNRVSFWKWNVGERFVVYLGTCDLLFGVSHFLDHAYMFHKKSHPPDDVCIVFAFVLHEFIFAQWMVVVSSAICACALVVFGKKLYLGRWDWKLILFAFGTPFTLGVIGVNFQILGPSGAWCLVDLRTDNGILYNEIITILQVVLFILVALAYGSIWAKIQSTTKLMEGSTTERYQSSARVMLIFVAVFIFQWWSTVLYNIWVLVSGDPPPGILVLAVIVVNFGGVYNAVAYTFIRRRLQMRAAKAARFRYVVNKLGNDGKKAEPTPGVSAAISAPDRQDLQGGVKQLGGPIGASGASASVVEIHT